jgi:hypothetical protein
MIIEESVCSMSCEPIFFCNYSYVVHTEYIFFFSSTWTLRMSDNLVERVKILGHAHILYRTTELSAVKYFAIYFKYFHLICHLILTKINCITLKIRSKADFKSKSQNIWQQIILFSDDCRSWPREEKIKKSWMLK